jgi:hypothetical protein
VLGRLAGVALALLTLGSPPGARADTVLSSAKESELKAAFIFNFIRFTAWPATSFASEQAPLVVEMFAEASVGAALERLVANRTVNGHRIEVRTGASIPGAEDMHVLYVDAARESRVSEAGSILGRKSLLTIGDSDRFLGAGGIIRFIIEGDRLRFEVNAAASQAAGLTLSSQLLMLATKVRMPP